MQREILTITGPTASGKTALTKLLSQNGDFEVISCDSRQVFRQLNIGTAKPSAEDLGLIPHHFINELDLKEPFSAGIFAEQANKRIKNIIERGKHPVVLGGSTLYLQALQFGLDDLPVGDGNIRAELKERLKSGGSDDLYHELQRVDPEFAAGIDPTKTQRLIRALEVYKLTGTPISKLLGKTLKPQYIYKTIVLDRDRSVLYDRINKRVDHMITTGLISEVQGLLEAGYSPHINALQTIGYKETINYLNRDIDLEQLPIHIKQNTRRYAKRQLTWFRRFSNYKWVNAEDEKSIIDFIRSAHPEALV